MRRTEAVRKRPAHVEDVSHPPPRAERLITVLFLWFVPRLIYKFFTKFIRPRLASSSSNFALRAADSGMSPPPGASPPPAPRPNLPPEILRAIYGEQTLEEKRSACDRSINNWWQEYAARKNDEEEDHVADTLLYDERCHLPRTVPRPDVVPDPHARSSPPPQDTSA
tara:strand:+ start:181 stop:681 length:501 start_codon:yes stop_codon:yes gene_type:complete